MALKMRGLSHDFSNSSGASLPTDPLLSFDFRLLACLLVIELIPRRKLQERYGVLMGPLRSDLIFDCRRPGLTRFLNLKIWHYRPQRCFVCFGFRRGGNDVALTDRLPFPAKCADYQTSPRSSSVENASRRRAYRG